MQADASADELAATIRPYLVGFDPSTVMLTIAWPDGSNDLGNRVSVTVTAPYCHLLPFLVVSGHSSTWRNIDHDRRSLGTSHATPEHQVDRKRQAQGDRAGDVRAASTGAARHGRPCHRLRLDDGRRGEAQNAADAAALAAAMAEMTQQSEPQLAAMAIVATYSGLSQAALSTLQIRGRQVRTRRTIGSSRWSSRTRSPRFSCRAWGEPEPLRSGPRGRRLQAARRRGGRSSTRQRLPG